MTRRLMTMVGIVAMAGVGVAGCGGGEQPAGDAPPAATAPAGTTEAGAGDLDIAFTSTPMPPRAGENAFEVAVTGPDGQPVTDADVSVEFYMAAMPSMNMAEMRNRIDLAHEGGGRYRGTGDVMMAGPWDVTVRVARGGEAIGSETLSVVAQ